eukprot:TRINITY_DN1111_c1_g1_i10.p1 TRINITY_DN1111_c1_g1~~TRINITY_DN1111_c1_g1_i10.p1  ORF type:complete len:197 (+),score=31.45 TRINITY_DN1111_c1_g1_i10:28-591(+)
MEGTSKTADATAITAVRGVQQQWTCVAPHTKLHVHQSVITRLEPFDFTHAAVVHQRKYTAGVHSFTVELVASERTFNFACFGVTSNPQLPTCDDGHAAVGLTDDSWAYYPLNNGVFHDCEYTKLATGDGRGAVNDKIMITVDMDHHTMSVTVNGQHRGVVYRDLPAAVYPAISLWYPYDKVKVTFAD